MTIEGMALDGNGMEILGRDESLALLATVPVVRIGLSMDALPVVLPVNFAIDDDEVIIRTVEGSKLDAATQNAVVAIEGDDVDPWTHAGWSVLIRGRSRLLRLPGEIERARQLHLRPWAGDGIERYIAVTTDLVSGRRISGRGVSGWAHRPAGLKR